MVALLNQSHLGANVQEASGDAAEANLEYQHARTETSSIRMYRRCFLLRRGWITAIFE